MLEINPVAKAVNGAIRYSGTIKVLENISDKFFKVKVESKAGAQELTVFSKNNLSPGDIIKGTIIARGNNLYLSVLKSVLKKQENSSPAFIQSEKNSHISKENSIIPRFLTSFLDSSGSKADNTLLSILESLISKKKITDRFYAALAGEAYLKGLKNEYAISAFLDAVSPYNEKNPGGQKHGKKNHNKENIKEILSEAISDSEKENSALFIFNHLPLPNKNWMIIPFKIDDIKGDLRLKTTENLLKNLVIHIETGDFKWFFELSDLKNNKKKVKIYANKEGTLLCNGKKFDQFKKKLHNLGAIIDDNIYDIEIFDGFSKVNASYDVDLRI